MPDQEARFTPVFPVGCHVSVTRTDGGGWITTCPHPECDWQAYHPTLRGADKALHQHTRDKHPKERP